ncbi:MAG: formylglycine-generating enzyme family protein [Alphaproteobacteria bacterium]|nr:formylglycine-generating enzyme family protein [Alphaproteobacteria bacterium]
MTHTPHAALQALALEAGWKRWAARRTLLLRLPESVGDLGEVVDGVDAFAQGTTNGDDLFWARELLRRVARGEVAGVASGDAVAAARVRAGVLAEALLGRHRPEERAALQRSLDAQGLWRTLPAGTRRVGTPDGEDEDERPAHTVTLLRPLQMLAVPVTWAMYERFDPGHAAARESFDGRCPADAQDDHPVYTVTWHAAVAFADWLGARLPLEAEWEVACRANTTTRYWSGDTEADLAAVGWTRDNAGGHPHPVASPPTPRGHAHPWGLYDMHGNVWEWCLDPGVSSYQGREAGVTLDPNGPQLAVQGRGVVNMTDDLTAARVIRGGSWNSHADDARSAYRDATGPEFLWFYIGFRLVMPALGC